MPKGKAKRVRPKVFSGPFLRKSSSSSSVSLSAPSKYFEDAPSVWKLAETYWLSLVLCKEALCRWKDPLANPAKWIQFVGKDREGAWTTTQAKAYPSRLNAALVEAVFLKAQSNFDSFLQAVHRVQIAQETSGKEMGADFAR